MPGRPGEDAPGQLAEPRAAQRDPGGGVHGGPGDIAARVALRSARLGELPGRALTRVTRYLGSDTRDRRTSAEPAAR